MNFEAFQDWLDVCGYAATTKRLSIQHVNYAHRKWVEAGKMPPVSLPPAARKGCKLYLAYVQETGTQSRFSAFLEAEIALSKQETKRFGVRKPRGRKREARSIDDTSWRELADAIERDPSDEARVLDVMVSTGLRIGDVLRVTEPALRSALRTGRLVTEVKGQREVAFPIEGSHEVWDRLHRSMVDDPHHPKGGWKNVAHWICPNSAASPLAGDCAYARVHRRLKKICASCELTERIHLHRIRRTVAVQALRLTSDVRAVQGLLGHASLKSTSAYLDEARPEAVIEVQRKIRERFR